MRLARMSDEEFEGMITVHNEEVIESHVADEKQVVIVTGHLGCWEILRAWLPFKGLKLASIAKRLYDVRLEKLLLRSRQSTGTQVITVGRNTRDLFRLIRDGYSPGFLIDVDTNVKGVFVHFFGHLSFTPAAAAEIALKYDMPVILPLPYRDRDGQHHIEIHGPLKVTKTGDTQVDTVSLTAAATKVIEDFIRRHPEQWPWFHKRWKRKPPEETQ
jgi:KDO2-lipid IV(A) lauroyltransferase